MGKKPQKLRESKDDHGRWTIDDSMKKWRIANDPWRMSGAREVEVLMLYR